MLASIKTSFNKEQLENEYLCDHAVMRLYLCNFYWIKMLLKQLRPYKTTILNLERSYSVLQNSSKGLEVTQHDAVRIIKLNRPDKLNALNKDLYTGIVTELQNAANDDSTVITALTGSGDYFTSGNDLNMFSSFPKTQTEFRHLAEEAGVILENFVAAFIDFPKPLAAVVNGPAIGIGGTILGLMDFVYASDRASFSFPFVRLGQGPEGCSSYTFPRIMGPAKSGEVLYFGRKIDAVEAEKLGLVTRVIPHQDIDSIWTELRNHANLPSPSLFHCKHLIRDFDKLTLHKVNKKECSMLIERWSSPQAFEAVSKMFLKKKNKL